jgi:hypothetical protein
MIKQQNVAKEDITALGIAEINSPALTGTPTSPTADISINDQ